MDFQEGIQYWNEINKGDGTFPPDNAAGSNASATINKLRAAFHLGLLVSPLYLLLPFRIVQRSLSRRLALQLHSQLAACKSPLLIEVERIIWRSVIKLAKGNNTAIEVLTELSTSLPWSRIEMASNSDERDMFRPLQGKFPLLYSVHLIIFSCSGPSNTI
jgi:hypothetical protein